LRRRGPRLALAVTVAPIVNVHGSSGFTDADLDCRQAQFGQVFVDMGDGKPAANGERNVIMGDFNTDPVRAAFLDWSPRRHGGR